MHFLILILFSILTLQAKASYEIQLFASKANNVKSVQLMIQKGISAGLECYESKEYRVDGAYIFARCDKTTNYQDILQSEKKAQQAGLDYYLLKDRESSVTPQIGGYKQDKNIPPFAIDTTMKLDDSTSSLFGINTELMQILQNKNQISKSELAQRKATYLKSIASNEKFNGLYLKGSSSNNFDLERSAYNLRLQWDIFDEGYFASQKDVEKMLLNKELEYERIMDEYRRSNLELSLYKMQAISNYINYHFLKQQEKMLFSMAKRAKKKYSASLITSDTFFKRKKAHEHVKHTLSYYKAMEKEQYDEQLKPLMNQIEYISFAEKNVLSQHAYQNSFELKNSKNKIALSGIDDDWIDRLKTNVYVEKKKISYLNNSETVAGVQVQIPLDFNDNDISKKIEVETNTMRAQSLKKLITRNIDEIYYKIEFHKNYIKTLKSDIGFFRNEAKTLELKAKYPLEKQTKDLQLEGELLTLAISKHNQKIWLERTEILKLLLKLQNISGVQILPSHTINNSISVSRT